jgi:crotonobetainyl-CoA:carnitine CoA-transferase CaiB-like acyl-CoA transferase
MAHVVRTPDGTVLGAGRLDPFQYGIGPLNRLYETSDGWVCVVAELDEERAALGGALGVELAGLDDDAVADALTEAFAGRTSADALAVGAGAGVAIVAPTLGRPNHEFMNDPENRRTRRVAEVPHPVKGNVREIDQLIRISHTVAPPHKLAPELGEDSDEILSSLGYEKDAVAELRERNAVR